VHIITIHVHNYYIPIRYTIVRNIHYTEPKRDGRHKPTFTGLIIAPLPRYQRRVGIY